MSSFPVNPGMSIFELISRRAGENPNRVSYTMLDEDLQVTESLTYAQLDRQSRQLAGQLLKHEPGTRALILVPSTISFMVAFLGCLHAGVVAVPAPVPDANQIKQRSPRLRAIAQDCAPKIVISAERTAELVRAACDSTAELTGCEHVLLESGDEPAEPGRLRPARPGDVAYLQYTSGSTATPKGVMVSQRNLLEQSSALSMSLDYRPTASVSAGCPTSTTSACSKGRCCPCTTAFRRSRSRR
ncbi:AMP-binding protein [Kibdelosporangium philippinense]|uniref:AMP-binding protein n=1 Tax=Kibdelosporangium philippinense TaxID=211113 RepID=UPI00355651C9